MTGSAAPTLLLLQARIAEDPMRAHEQEAFARQSGLPLENVVCHDLGEGPPSLAKVKQHGALTVGGAGEYYVTKGNLPHWEEFLDFLRAIVAEDHPTFASCFGYQSLVHALGGTVIHDPDRSEVGTYGLRLTDEGANDPLLGSLPLEFNAQMGHKDRVTELPEGLVNLASSPLSPHQALRVVGRSVWATQFHPELDKETNLNRFYHYLQGYAEYMDEEEQKATVERFAESREVSGLLPRFFELIFG